MKGMLFSAILSALIGIASRANAAGIDVDVVYYYGDDSLTYCEIYVGVQRSTLVYRHGEADSVIAQFSIVTSIGRNDTTFISDTLDTVDRSPTRQVQMNGAYFPYIFRYLLVPSEYDLNVELLQTSGRANTWEELRLFVPQISDSFGSSGIALGAELAYDAAASQFTKNGVRFVPNPSLFYGSGLPMLYYYAECYGLNDNVTDDSVTVTRTVLLAESNQLAKLPATRKLAIPGKSIVIADGFPAYTLRTGTYVLNLKIEEVGKADRTVSKKFYVYRPEDLAEGRETPIDNELAYVLSTSGEDILNTIDPDSGIVLMQHVLTKQEMRRARDMDSDGKRNFMIDFWSKHFPDDPDAANRHFARVHEANSRYSYLNREGWKTDRGRVLIQFGEPDYIDRRYADAAGSDHEIWYYDKLEGGVLFVFVDQAGFGDLDLVHSTKRGEIYNPSALATQQNQNPASRGLRE
ncbi:MAG: GWxTD domain-containing protein [bacterium]|nr:GWxTD domain-containing protein [bacterium]